MDSVDPTAVCQDLVVLLDGDGMAAVVPEEIDGGSSDNCALATLEVDRAEFDCDDVGSNGVELTATDQSGNTSQCTAALEVRDEEAPVAACTAGTVQLGPDGKGVLTVEQIDDGSTDNCSVTVSVPPIPVDCSDLFGFFEVDLTATDPSGNTAACKGGYDVVDALPPIAVCQDVTVQVGPGGAASVTDADIDGGSSDNCGVSGIFLDRTSFQCPLELGPNAVVLTVTDVAGDESTCSAIVTVEDLIPPVINCNDATVQLDANGNGAVPVDIAFASDNCFEVQLQTAPSVLTCADVGGITAESTATDGSGNTATCQSTVAVEDIVAPQALCQDLNVEVGDVGSVSITALDVDNGSADACGLGSLSIDQDTFSCAEAGAAPTVILTVVDVNGNASSCSSSVTVEDNTAPFAFCQDVTLPLDSLGTAILTPSAVNLGSSDVCDANPTLSLSQDSFSCADLGTVGVTLDVTDDAGNISNCAATITVTDPDDECS